MDGNCKGTVFKYFNTMYIFIDTISTHKTKNTNINQRTISRIISMHLFKYNYTETKSLVSQRLMTGVI